MRTFRRPLALLAALGLFFAACGDDDVDTDDPAGQVEDEMEDMEDEGMDDMESEDDMGDEDMEDGGGS